MKSKFSYNTFINPIYCINAAMEYSLLNQNSGYFLFYAAEFSFCVEKKEINLIWAKDHRSVFIRESSGNV